jgi:mannose-1-phosphate guanylyltransferase
MAVLPADHYIAQQEAYRNILRQAFEIAREPNRMVVLGILPTYPETGYGYIERAAEPAEHSCAYFTVRRFTEKPALPVARQYIASGNYFWNAGMFFWRVSTFLNALKEYLPGTFEAINELSAHIGKSAYRSRLNKLYPKLENISVDYAILERAATEPARVFVIPADIGWSDIGSWAAVYDLQAKAPGENILAGAGEMLDANGNFLWSPDKFVAAIGVQNLIVVETPDALLICPRDRAQDVSKLVKSIEERKLKKLL